MDNKTFISIEFWQLVGFLLSFLGVCWGFGKMLLAQFQAQQAERQKQYERLQSKVEQMERTLGEFSAALPMTYVLREDYIRNQVVLEAKIDKISEKLTEIYKMESQKND
ncbi:MULTISPECIES: hypothetical protein [Neisseriaceae]|uniref:Uncharacterized protein n=2 Tax=Neisseriaceae TaxID=481 RepID=A0A378UK40_BERDE|nr:MULTISPECIES: hypothetical protein [Neisseriaceae]QEY23519.1 hypothetical protein D0T90_02560 [Neisseria animalis]ROW32119.1 hypothetical protein CGZ60_05940 [Neisseria animalis]STZ76074.1 Uncharacterised protein [Bergeriella denitrificans]STZ77490.1 Uncharacterised protein [Bergeriella denitrificans]STZ83050.1 Uncharacterised protein [Bergeriella denitrificans]